MFFSLPVGQMCNRFCCFPFFSPRCCGEQGDLTVPLCQNYFRARPVDEGKKEIEPNKAEETVSFARKFLHIFHSKGKKLS